MGGEMDQRRLKILVETGDYKMEPALVAQAMLRRRGVRELLTREGLPLSPTDQTRPGPEAPRQAA